MASYHVNNFGKFGGNIPRDLQGFTHTTPEEWGAAPMDWGGCGAMVEDCEDLAERSIRAIDAAENALARWQEVTR